MTVNCLHEFDLTKPTSNFKRLPNISLAFFRSINQKAKNDGFNFWSVQNLYIFIFFHYLIIYAFKNKNKIILRVFDVCAIMHQ